MKPRGILPKEDSYPATQNILLAAHSMGLGTRILGLVAGAMQKRPEIEALAGIPLKDSVHAVMAIGYPSESYVTKAGRKKAEIPITRL